MVFRFYPCHRKRAVREAPDAHEIVSCQWLCSGARHRIEHIETIAPVDIPSFFVARIAFDGTNYAERTVVEVWLKPLAKSGCQIPCMGSPVEGGKSPGFSVQ